mmetsp:Transcript_37915/g.105642  ORF Transcript_37915/g.105642 Transcript_37915/m.105642 type:complete len:119 (+) Transcript_37915:534-890(+)
MSVNPNGWSRSQGAGDNNVVKWLSGNRVPRSNMSEVRSSFTSKTSHALAVCGRKASHDGPLRATTLPKKSGNSVPVGVGPATKGDPVVTSQYPDRGSKNKYNAEATEAELPRVLCARR